MKFTEAVRKQLESNPNVLKVTESHIVFTAEFKLSCIKKKESGISPKRIFADFGINPALFRKDYCKHSIARWTKILKSKGESGLNEEQRGKSKSNMKGRPKKVTLDDLSIEDMKAIITAQQEVIEELKKRKALADKKKKK